MEHMQRKLQELQSQSDGFQLEIKRKESHLNMQRMEREQLSSQIHVADELYSREKQGLVEEIIQLKRQKVQKDTKVSAKEMEILHAKQELEQQQMNLSNSEQAILILRAKVKQRSEQQKVVEMQISGKRGEFLKLQSTVHTVEDEIFKKRVAMQEHITHELRNEISFFHQQIRHKELQAEQNRVLRRKMMDDYAALTKENAALQSRLLELGKQMDIERTLKEKSYTSHTASVAHFLTVKDHQEHLQREIKRHQELLEQEKKTFQKLKEQISVLEYRSTSLDLSTATMSSLVAEIRAMLYKEEQNNLELKRDKALLVDLIVALENKLAGKETSFLQASTRMLQLDEAISALKTKHVLHQSLESKKWEQISKMANSMKNLNKSITDVVANTGQY
ncbi:centrosomal protein of 135 kDa-like [Eublepharis macularius]|uniref:Centrosomal protein of 135 kDa-like n=1 Tax=Eublepharis macularius TaxID=481883 RepID=A0AA97KJM2_EUBMA|nr:centrosomal protein of 135 kDa-like [Eublepharis macularius]